MNRLPAEKLFQTYMDLISKRESEEIYRLNEPIGEGIMKHSHIAKGIELVYSELESYSPNYQAEKKEVDGLEIMYIVDGHGEFELQNRQFASGEKDDANELYTAVNACYFITDSFFVGLYGNFTNDFDNEDKWSIGISPSAGYMINQRNTVGASVFVNFMKTMKSISFPVYWKYVF